MIKTVRVKMYLKEMFKALGLNSCYWKFTLTHSATWDYIS